MLDKSVFASKVWSFIVYLNETILINQSICIHFNIITDSIVPIRLLENSELLLEERGSGLEDWSLMNRINQIIKQ